MYNNLNYYSVNIYIVSYLRLIKLKGLLERTECYLAGAAAARGALVPAEVPAPRVAAPPRRGVGAVGCCRRVGAVVGCRGVATLRGEAALLAEAAVVLRPR